MKILINFAAQRYFAAQKRNTNSGYKFGGFDKVIEYGKNDIDSEFKKKYKKILSHDKGAGYWLWKPYIIKKTLEESECGDFVFYSDAGAEFISSINPLVEICKKDKKNITLFHLEPLYGAMESHSCKRDIFVIMQADTPKYTDTLPLLASFQLYQNNSFTKDFIKENLKYCCYKELILDTPNVYGFDNYPGFKYCRHDQSILSVLSKKWNIVPHRDPSQYGNPYMKPEDGYEQIINHTRKND